MVVVAPFGEVVGEFESAGVGGGVFEVDDDELFVLVCGEEERGFTCGLQAEEVAVLGVVVGEDKGGGEGFWGDVLRV